MAKPVTLRMLGLILIFTNTRMTASYAYQQTSPIFRVIIVSNQEFVRPGISWSGAYRIDHAPRRSLMAAFSLSSTVPGLFLVKRILAELRPFCNREPDRRVSGLFQIGTTSVPMAEGACTGFTSCRPPKCRPMSSFNSNGG